MKTISSLSLWTLVTLSISALFLSPAHSEPLAERAKAFSGTYSLERYSWNNKPARTPHEPVLLNLTVHSDQKGFWVEVTEKDTQTLRVDCPKGSTQTQRLEQLREEDSPLQLKIKHTCNGFYSRADGYSGYLLARFKTFQTFELSDGGQTLTVTSVHDFRAFLQNSCTDPQSLFPHRRYPEVFTFKRVNPN